MHSAPEQLFEAGPRILSTEDEEVAAAAAAAFRGCGMEVRECFGAIDSFEKAPAGVRMNFSKDGKRDSAEAELVVVAVGWVADIISRRQGSRSMSESS